jgi:hypothetical protein
MGVVHNFRHSMKKKRKLVTYYFEFKTHFFRFFSELKISISLIFDVLFFTLRLPRKHNFPGRTSDLAKRVLNFSDSEIYLLAKVVDFFN